MIDSSVHPESEFAEHLASFVAVDEASMEVRTFYGNQPGSIETPEYVQVNQNLHRSMEASSRLKAQQIAAKAALKQTIGGEDE